MISADFLPNGAADPPGKLLQVLIREVGQDGFRIAQ